EMRSYQNPDGSGEIFWGNSFAPIPDMEIPRDRWIAAEVMVKMNSSPQERDGELAFWIDGKLALHLAPGTVKGYWLRDKFHRDDPHDPRNVPFEGFRWRIDPRVAINQLWLSTYYSDSPFEQSEEY